jgi:hypothetical protein|tara:strand:- start:69 stop:218 length:150 start_codon:yes stop_codon:yes gene_type:complete
MSKFRPQILLAIIVLGIMGTAGLWMESIETATATIGGIIALGMKLLEGE